MEDGSHGVDDQTLDARLLDAVPGDAKRIVVVSASPGDLVDQLQARHPEREVSAVTVVSAPEGRRLAGHELRVDSARREPSDRRFRLDPDHDDLPFERGTVDAIVYADTLSRVRDPLAVLERHRAILSPSGTISCTFANVQHHSVVSLLLRGTFPYRRGGLLDPASVRLFTAASAMDLLLDAGFAPNVVARQEAPGADAFVTVGAPLLEHLGVGPPDARRAMNASHLVVRGELLPDPGPDTDAAVTFVACVNDDAQLEANLLRSPDLAAHGRHEVLLFRGCSSAAEGLNAGIERAQGELVVLVHQDVYLPKRWVTRLLAQWRLAQGGAERPIGLAGVFGVADRRTPYDAIGHVVHRDRLLTHGRLPADVDGLDELLMVVPRGTELRADPALGWHLYGTDLALQAQQAGARVIVVDALCHHDSLTGRVPVGYRDSERVLARKWRSFLPIHTNLSSIGAWLLDEPGPDPTGRHEAADDGSDGDRPAGAETSTIAELVDTLRAERGALTAELERARHQIASMQASPFWRARDVVVRLLHRRRR